MSIKSSIRLILSCMMVVSCDLKKDVLVQIDQLQFQTTDASELFFKNVRRSDYIETELRHAGMNSYLSNHSGGTAILLRPQLIINWRNDQAFILLETKDISDTENVTIELIGSEIRKLNFDLSNQRNHAILCGEIYNSILRGQEVKMSYDQQKASFFSDEGGKEAFRRVFFDFLRLTEQR